MTSAESTLEPQAAPTAPVSAPPSSGWRVVARKELADQLLSVRFIVVFIMLGLSALVPLFLVGELIRSAAGQASGLQALFLALYTIGPDELAGFSAASFVGVTAPLVGVALAFDAINGERAQGTLPRLVSQPIHRDAVINGKFAAGLVTISLVLVSVVLIISAFGLLRLGIVPTGAEILRLVVWVAGTIVYTALWMAFALLLSVILRRAATAALAGFGTWLLVVVFAPILLRPLLLALMPTGGATGQEVLSAMQWQALLFRLLPPTLYNEASAVILNPEITQRAIPGTLATLGQYDQASQQISTLLSLDQSLLLIWPHVVALVAITVICFALAYVRFMSEEVRA
jgi:ABC-2 type transport system permease protein